MSAIELVSRARARETGAIGIMFAGGLIVLFGFFALALDLSQLYNRKMELQNMADTVALAAAAELNGTRDGVVNALTKASEPISAAAGAPTWQYGASRMTWADDAMTFASSPSGPWLDAVAAKSQFDGLFFVKVDTARLDAQYGMVAALFAHVIGNAAVTTTSAHAIAGRSAIKVTPLGICAMRDQAEAYRNHNGELEEYGFRRGVGYNLLDLNRADATAGVTFIVNPYPSATAVTRFERLAPFVCTGTMAMARLTGGTVTVSPTFPIGDLFDHLNSRFGTYTSTTAPCDARTAPSDVNIKAYTYATAAPWMATKPLHQSAFLSNADQRRWTVAGPDTAPAGTTADKFGPLWSYAKAVKFSKDQSAAVPEPPGGYPTFEVGDWKTLYNPGQPTTSTATPYPTSATEPTPYSTTSGSAFYKASPSGNKSVANRRVLNLPLLACPVSGSTATVLAVGKFFMTVPSTNTSLYGEFAGLAAEQSLGTRMVLYP